MKQGLTFAAVLLPTTVLAHPGGHGGFSAGALLSPIPRDTGHGVMVLAALAPGAALFWRAGSRT